VAYNGLAVVLAALRGVHGQAKIDHEFSLYDMANEVATTYNGMMIAIPEAQWRIFSAMSQLEVAEMLMELAHYVRLEAFKNQMAK
jgi:hypothetical protein